MNRQADERPAPLCANYPEVYDALEESSRGDDRWAFLEAQTAAKNLCGTCLLRTPDVAKPCLSAARKDGERWVDAVLGKKLKPAVVRETCGKSAGYTAHIQNREATCQKCRTAEVRRNKERQAKRRAAA